MAEVIAALGVVASVAQLADYGFKLSVKLFAYSEAVYKADESMKSISSDVSLTSTVLKELCQIIKSDESRVVSNGAIEATAQTVKECLAVFEQFNDALDKSMGSVSLEIVRGKKKIKRGMVALEKLKWPFKQPKMELFRSNLDRLKASLTLMLQVLSYARDVSSRQAAESSLIYQQHIIESLARSEKAMKQKYFALQHAIEPQGSPEPFFNATINTAVHVTGSSGFDDLSPTLNTSSKNTDLSPPTVKPQTLIAELLLCFQLLNDLLGYQMLVMRGQASFSNQHDEILTAVRNGVKLYDDAPQHDKVEAAKNVQLRVREIVQDRYLKPRPIQQDNNSQQDSFVEKNHRRREEIQFIGFDHYAETIEDLYLRPEDVGYHPHLSEALTRPLSESPASAKSGDDSRFIVSLGTGINNQIYCGRRASLHGTENTGQSLPGRGRRHETVDSTAISSTNEIDTLEHFSPDTTANKILSSKKNPKLTTIEWGAWKKERMARRNRGEYVDSSDEDLEAVSGLQSVRLDQEQSTQQSNRETTSEAVSESGPVIVNTPLETMQSPIYEPVSPSYSPISPASSIGDVAVKWKLWRKINRNETSVAERSEYQIEEDSEDSMYENEIDANLAALSGNAARLNALAKATGKEVDSQNRHIDRVVQKSDSVDVMIRARLAHLGRDSANETILPTPKPALSLSESQNPSTQQSTQDQKDVDFPIETQAYRPAPSTSATTVDDAQIAAAMELLQQNFEKVSQRGEHLDALQEIAETVDRQASPKSLTNQYKIPVKYNLLYSTCYTEHSPPAGTTETVVAKETGGALGAGLPIETRREKQAQAVNRYEEDKVDDLQLPAGSDEYTLNLESSLEEEMRCTREHTDGFGNAIYDENCRNWSNDDHGEALKEDDDVLAGLLAQWTNLPLQETSIYDDLD